MDFVVFRSVLGVFIQFIGLDSDYFGRISFFGFVTEKLFTSNRYFFTVAENGFLDELAAVLFGFCKTKIEDEYILNIRLSLLVWQFM